MDQSLVESSFESAFFWCAAHRVIICKSHGYAIATRSLAWHVNRSHKTVTSDTRKRWIEHAERLGNHTPVCPTVPIAPLPFLKLYKNCYRCTNTSSTDKECGYIATTLTKIKLHNRTTHFWVNPRGQGRSKNTLPESSLPYKAGVFAQRFFVSGTDQSYFEVLISRSTTGSSHSEESDSDCERYQLLARGKWVLEVALTAPTNQVSLSATRLEPNPWLDRAGWAVHLRGFAPDQMRAWIELPSRIDLISNPTPSAILTTCIKALFRRAVHMVASGTIPENSRFHVYRKETGEQTSERPLYGKLQGETIVRYATVWCQVLLYISNTCDLPLEDRPKYTFTSYQLAGWKELMARIVEGTEK